MFFAVLNGELAVPFTCNPPQQGLIPTRRQSFARPEPIRSYDDRVPCNRTP